MSPRPAKAADPAAMLDVLRRGVVLTADSVRAALDEAVRHGHLTPRDAAELSQALLSAGRAQADGLRAELEQVLGRGPAFPIKPPTTELTARQVQARLCDPPPPPSCARSATTSAAARTARPCSRRSTAAWAQAERASYPQVRWRPPPARAPTGARSSSCASTTSPTAAPASRATSGYVVFVRDAIPGDLVRAVVTKRKRPTARRACSSCSSPRPTASRRVADHPGAPWQVLPYERQLETKARAGRGRAATHRPPRRLRARADRPRG